jgi:hypothetical protein
MSYETNLNFAKHSISDNQIKLILKTVDNVSPDQIDWLESKDYWWDLHTKFQQYIDKYFYGTHIVAMPYDSPDIIRNLNKIQIPDSKYQVLPMNDSECHDNVIKLFKSDPTLHIFTGYVLSTDGLWRYHSWATSNDGSIIETTESRLIYIGKDLTSKYQYLENKKAYQNIA